VNTRVARVFFAIKPDDTALIKLNNIAKQLASKSGGYPIRSDKIHLTLLFVGNVNLEQLPRLRSVTNRISANSFKFSIAGIKYWKRNHIIFAATNQTNPELLALIKALQQTLSDNGFSFDQQSVTPHITLVRKASNPVLPQLAEPISWSVQEWLLIQSKQTNQRIDYISLDRWSLKHPESIQP
jgi:2'-5' RNA ligase